VNHEVTSEQFNDWLTPLKMRLMQAIQRSSQLQRLSLVITNVAGSIVMLSPVIVFLVASIITIYFAYTSRGPLDWFFCLVFFGITLVSGYLSIQLHQLRLTDTDGVSVVPQQAPELLGMIERRVSHFGIRAPDRILLTVGSELKIMHKPHWPVPLMHKTMLWVGAPLLFFGELKLDSSSDCQRFQTGLIFSQQHRPSRTDITNQTGFKKAVEGNAP